MLMGSAEFNAVCAHRSVYFSLVLCALAGGSGRLILKIWDLHFICSSKGGICAEFSN